MNDIQVLSENTLSFDGKTYQCAIGGKGFADAHTRKEGSNTTPRGRFALRECWYRPDKLSAPHTVLMLRHIQQDDGWCDDSSHPQYNRHVKLPFAASHEKLWREDAMYDIIVPLGFNDSPVVPGLGSAIFMHVAKPESLKGAGYSTTEGCVALALPDLLELLEALGPHTQIVI